MIKKIKDFTKVVVNKEDVLIEAVVKVKQKSNLDYSHLDEKTR